MTVSRFVFFKYYGKGISFDGLVVDIFKVFFLGLRYDLAVLAYSNMPVTLVLTALLFFNKESFYNKISNYTTFYYTIIIGSLFIILGIDFCYYSYFQNHINIMIFGLFEDDTKALISTLVENYNMFLVVGSFILSYILTFIISKLVLKFKYKDIHEDKKIISRILIAVLMITVNFAAARGSFGIFPLGVDDAQISLNTFLNKVAINGIYTLQEAIEIKSNQKDFDYAAKTGYKGNIKQAFADYLNIDISQIPEQPEQSLLQYTSSSKEIENIKPNVIFIMVESFGSGLLRYNSKEFNVLGELKKHFDEDIVFYNFLPSHAGTIGSLEGAMTNVARCSNSWYIAQSKYSYKKYDFAGPIPYKKNNYETTFIFGGKTGWRNVSNFMPILGFDNVLGEASMSDSYSRNQWGVYDEDLFEYLFEVLDKDDKRKFIYVMTTTNHPPYSLPSDYKIMPIKIPEELDQNVVNKSLAQKRLAVYQYSNEVLGRFITKIKNSKYADNTIIAVTGDHNFMDCLFYPTERLLDALSVPFYLYIPEKIRPINVDVSAFGSHLDIMPTLYNISLSNCQYMAMGKNLISNDAKDNIIFMDNGVIMSRNGVVEYNFFSKDFSCYIWNKNKYREIVPSYMLKDKDMIKHYLSGIAVSEYLIKNTGK
jgi:phosphoglycerol transferase MdoB-like AlkP superfamily enzyme